MRMLVGNIKPKNKRHCDSFGIMGNKKLNNYELPFSGNTDNKLLVTLLNRRVARNPQWRGLFRGSGTGRSKILYFFCKNNIILAQF